ncbi:DUF3499 domain-containing protein [Natronoglycomyces albus]|uniref:DUF3499 domain-containing protein n=1 Tax=Natronoglycomyces albus TaxID=2811108 RepID=A0A895XRC8_9ACTN|nr:DUF3499 domain-containing protein [Natronoglycomyces albus]QSB05899.1 DUF3499 domain-containing protein [Natronoglycomyces albus]
MRSDRRCSRNGCRQPAVATLTYIYSDSTAVVGPLATAREPHSYDLCDTHARRLTAPRGWELVRHQGDYSEPMPTDDDLVALANAVREAAGSRPEEDNPAAPPEASPIATTSPSRPGAQRSAATSPQQSSPTSAHSSSRRHLRVVQSEDDAPR